jgi:uncharacterized protein YegJ (DUF2314 family)
MGILSRLFGKKKNEELSSEDTIMHRRTDEKMEQAILEARKTFKYFWRELYWENRRIIPGLQTAILKIGFSEQFVGEEKPYVEHMWVNDIYFDGEYIHGTLVSTPGRLTNVKNGDQVKVTIDDLTDWMIVSMDIPYGCFSIQAIRSDLNQKDRKKHDELNGMDFGDPSKILLAVGQQENPEYLIEHPMSINSKEQIEKHLAEYPDYILQTDEDGLSFLHIEAIAGNKTAIEVGLKFGADKSKKATSGKTPLDYAKQMGWDHLYDLLR